MRAVRLYRDGLIFGPQHRPNHRIADPGALGIAWAVSTRNHCGVSEWWLPATVRPYEFLRTGIEHFL